jgi:hypothetical protein
LECGKSLDYVEGFTIFRDALRFGGGAAEASRVRVRCALKNFRELSAILTAGRSIY